jgi:hypothetical protein
MARCDRRRVLVSKYHYDHSVGHGVLHARECVSEFDWCFVVVGIWQLTRHLVEIGLEHRKYFFYDAVHTRLHPAFHQAVDIMDKSSIRIKERQEAEVKQFESYLLEFEIFGVGEYLLSVSVVDDVFLAAMSRDDNHRAMFIQCFAVGFIDLN